jgi:hypothetical protein
MNLEKENDLLEILAEFDHEMWKDWALHILSEESISTTRVQRWARNFVSYDKLSEKEKEKNRVLARRVLRLIQEYLEEER